MTVDGVNPNIVTMTSWMPTLERFGGPRYIAIADALAADIREGRLAGGARLPTHRELAWQLGVTVGTVSRAYSEAERRGLIGGEVGRGTFVRAPRRADAALSHERRPRDLIELGVNKSPLGSEAALFAKTLSEVAAEADLKSLLSYQPHAGRPEDRDAVASWIGRTSGLEADPEQVILTDGAQHAMTAALASATRPGDAVGAECLTYPGFKALAAALDLKLVPIAIDRDGIVPEAFEAACREQRIRALYVVPNLQNPTGAVLPEARRRELARIAEACDVMIVEDDVYGFLLETPPPPIASFTRTHATYVGGASKSLAPGLRVGWLHAPVERLGRAGATMRVTTYMATPTMTEIVARWMRSGDADRLIVEKRRTAADRQVLARARLEAARRIDAHPRAFHLWATLPEPWRAEEFAAAARRRGVALTPAAAFHVGKGPAPEAVRICLGGTDDQTELERGLDIVGALLADAPLPYLSVV